MIIGALLIVVISLVFIDYFYYNYYENNLKAHALDNLVLVADEKKSQVFDFLRRISAITIDFSSDNFIKNSVKEIISGNESAVRELNAYLSSAQALIDKSIVGINIINSDGFIIASTADSEIGINELENNYFLKAKDLDRGSAYIGDVELLHHFGFNVAGFAVATPLIDGDAGNKKLGVIVNYINAKELSLILSGPAREAKIVGGKLFSTKKLELKKIFEAYLVNQGGLMITESRFIENSVLKQRVDTIPVKNCLNYKETKGNYENYLGIKVIGVSACVDGWTLILEMEEQEVFSEMANIKRSMILMLALIMIFIGLAVFYFVKETLRPLKALSEAAKKVGEGDLTQEVKIGFYDEVGQLAEVFNKMTHQLRESYAHLGQQVEEQTANLQKFKLAVENTSDHIIITDSDARILYANKAAEKTTGYLIGEMIGKTPSLWGKEMPLEFYQKMWKTIKTDKKVFNEEITNKRKNGEKYDAEVSISPILDKAGNLVFFVGIERDITHRKEVDRAKTEFVALASHQLRTPLTIINWYSEMLLSENFGTIAGKQKEYLEEIYNTNKRLVKLVNALLNVSRIDMGTFAVDPEIIDLKEIVESVFDEFKLSLQDKKIEIKTDFADDLPKISADKKLIRIIFENLISNSIKYTPKMGKINVSVKPKDNDILIMVADTGCGIPKNQQDKIFTKLFRADNAREIDTTGTGLGLYIVKSVINYANGKIWFESKEGKETIFYITIPKSGMAKKEGLKGLIGSK